MKLFKSRKTYYFYNPTTSSYERFYPSAKDRFFMVLRHLSTGILFGIATFFAMMYFIDSPKEALLAKENKLLLTQYEVLSLRLDETFGVLEGLQQRDNSLYRAIFQADPIPESIRRSGFGGANRYEHLMSLTNSKMVIETTTKLDILRKQLYIQSNSFDELVNLGKTQEERLRCIPAIQPISNRDLKSTASGYGWRIDPIYRTPKFHTGMDFSAKVGTDVYATGNGTVSFSGWRQGYGNTIIIDHGFGYQTLYAHLHGFNARVGQNVTRGEVIGYVGNTGKSTGAHLHYEVLVKGVNDNPAKYYFMDLTPEEYDRMLQIAENHGQVMD